MTVLYIPCPRQIVLETILLLPYRRQIVLEAFPSVRMVNVNLKAVLPIARSTIDSVLEGRL